MKKLFWLVFVMGYLFKGTLVANIIEIDPKKIKKPNLDKISNVYFESRKGTHKPTFYNPKTSEIYQITPEGYKDVIAWLMLDELGKLYTMNRAGETVASEFYPDTQDLGSPSGRFLYIHV